MIKQLLVRFVREDKGQDLIEYALLAGLIALVSIVAITLVGTNINTKMNSIAVSVAS